MRHGVVCKLSNKILIYHKNDIYEEDKVDYDDINMFDDVLVPETKRTRLDTSVVNKPREMSEKSRTINDVVQNFINITPKKRNVSSEPFFKFIVCSYHGE